jgi:hypothetical protein
MTPPLAPLPQVPILWGSTTPPPALAAGYNVHTFACSNFNTSTVDSANTKASGYKFYPYNIFGAHPPLTDLQLNANGSITLQGATTGPGGEITTVTPNSTGPGFSGTAFGGGGYFEASLSFNPANNTLAHSGWPAFWSISAEGTAVPQLTNQWAGQAVGYKHAFENDFFEYDVYQPGGAGSMYSYGSAFHESWGVLGVTCTPGFCRTSKGVAANVPNTTDFTLPHLYGCLWVPATSTTSGSSSYYFDRQLMSSFTYSQFLNNGVQTPPPTGQPWMGGVMDLSHLIVILGTGVGNPMNVYSVDVWQASAANNLVN